MSATSTYYNFIQKAGSSPVGVSGASPQPSQGPLETTVHRRRQAAASPSCSSIATSSSSSINSSFSLNGFGANTTTSNIGVFNSSPASMASPNSLASPCSTASTCSSSSTSSSSSSHHNHRQRSDLIRQASLTPTQGVDSGHGRRLFHSNTLHSLEPKPLKPFKSNNEYLEAMKEDLAEWFNSLYSDLDLNPENLFQHLETGAIICRHANNVTQMGRSSTVDEQQRANSILSSGSNVTIASLGNRCHQTDSQQPQQQETFGNTSSGQYNEPNNNNLMSSRSPSISSSSPNDSLQYQSHYRGSMKSPLSLNGSSSLMMISNGANIHSSRQHDYGYGTGHNQKTINWFQIKMIPFKQDALPGTFHARDNICQFILWCRSLNILECLLFETDDLVARKNEKSFILCLLEIARIGFKVGMPTPLIIQLEQEIDREIENDAKRQKQLEEEEREREKLNQDNTETTTIDSSGGSNSGCLVANEREDCDRNELDHSVHYYNNSLEQGRENVVGSTTEIVLDEAKIEEKQDEDDKRVQEGKVEEPEEEEELDFGPKPQVITNDLLSLHEKVVQLLCLCTCPTQFPMVRVGENGKYKVGDKLIIFVRILRRHIMVRVGGGWQELSEFLRVKDPCRAKSPPHNTHHHYNNQQSLQVHSYNHHQSQQQHQLNHLNQLQNANNDNQHQSLLPKLVPNSRSRLGESSHHLNKGHHNQSYRNNSGQRLISGSASMSWLSHNS